MTDALLAALAAALPAVGEAAPGTRGAAGGAGDGTTSGRGDDVSIPDILRCADCWHRRKAAGGGRCPECAAKRSAAMHARFALWATTQRAGVQPDVTTAVLHIGFLCLMETDEELAALRRDDTPAKVATPATSGVTRTRHLLRPIDRVAARVAPT